MSAGAGARLNRALRETRARLRHGLGLVLRSVLRPLSGTHPGAGPLDPAAIRSVLVVRINGRLGNTLFMTPLLRQLHELLPRASIDLAVSYPNATTLLTRMPGLDRVIVFPHKGGIRMVSRYFGALRRLRQRRYDLVIDPDFHSTNGRIVQSLSQSELRLGFDSPTQWAPLTHAVPPPDPVLHMGRAPLYLLARGFDLPWEPRAARLWLPLTAEEIALGYQAVNAALTQTRARTLARTHETDGATGDASASIDADTDSTIAPAGALAPASIPAEADTSAMANTTTRTIGFFSHATGLKALPGHWWLEFWSAFLELAPDAQPVEFLPTAATPPVNPAFASLNLPAQRLLTAAITSTRLFICADGGPMHLASSTDTPTLGLFNGHSDPVLYGPLKATDRSIDVRGLTPREVAREVYKAWSGLHQVGISPLLQNTAIAVHETHR